MFYLSLHSEAFGLGAFYEETTRELDARRAELLARTPEEAADPAQDTSDVIKMAVKFDRYVSSLASVWDRASAFGRPGPRSWLLYVVNDKRTIAHYGLYPCSQFSTTQRKHFGEDSP